MSYGVRRLCIGAVCVSCSYLSLLTNCSVYVGAFLAQRTPYRAVRVFFFSVIMNVMYMLVKKALLASESVCGLCTSKFDSLCEGYKWESESEGKY
jgi:ABC-type transport system involved in cytochrome c biogenesis permease subunit